MIERRTFLQGSAAGLALAFARTLRAEPGLIQLAARPTNYESVRSAFTQRITPLDQFFIRNHFDAPDINANYRLRIIVGVKKPTELTLEDLQKMKQVTVEAVLQCAGNGRGLFAPRIPGVQWKRGAMGNAEWTGVRLRDVLKAAGVTTEKHISYRGYDRPVLDKTPAFVRGIPIEKAMHPDTLIALKMNGQPLSKLHGGPARLVVPGWVGDDWMKWLSNIDVGDEAKGFFYETGYRFPVPPGKPGEAVPPANMQPMTKLVVKSLIGSISDGAKVPAGKLELVGVAFSGEARITKVDITLDGGATWTPAELDKHDSDYGFRVFKLATEVKPGTLTIGSRATDSTGAVQPKDAVWNPSGYLHNAIDLVKVVVA